MAVYECVERDFLRAKACFIGSFVIYTRGGMVFFLILGKLKFFRNDLLEYKKANANLNGNLHLSDGNSKKDGVIQWNNLFCDYFKGEILCSFDSDYHKELIDILSSKFDDIKQ